ncbi:MAG TPA: discoidin domain-containing protein, partial [Trebonia sp.]
GNGITPTTDLALNQPTTASTSDGTFVAGNATDGNTSTYWESNDGTAYPQTVTVQLAQVYPIGSLTLDLPPSTAWATRTETLSVLGSTNGTTFSQIVAPATYTFNPATGNTVTISLPSGTSAQYVELSFTANSGWTAAQLSELEVFPGTGGGGTSPSSALTASPSSLSFASTTVGSTSVAQTVTVSNPNTSAVSVSSVTASGPFSQTNTCGTSIAAGGSCTVSATFTPTATGSATGSLSVASNAASSPLTVALSGTGTASANPNLALNQPVTASSYDATYVASNATDGNTSSYWESNDGAAYPQTLTVNLGSVDSIGSVTLDLPPATAWATRTETLSVLGSTNDTTFSQIVASAGYTFNPSTGNTVTISLPSGTSAQYVQLSFTANTGWTAAQLSEFQVFAGGGSTGGSSALTASPSSVSFGNTVTGSTSTAQTVTVTNPGTSAATVSSVAVSGPFTQTSTCGTSIAAGGSCTVSVKFTPTAAGSASGTLSVASSATGSPLTVALSGTGISSTTDLALNAPVTASSYTQTYTPSNAVDGNTSTYWEANNGAWPTTYTVNLGSAQTLGSITIDLPPSTAWSTRTQTLSVLGSVNGTTYTTLVGSATYTWNPSTGNTVTIPLPAGTSDQYVQLSFTANNVQNGAQASEVLIYP